MWDYITISYEGANGYAKPVFTLNKDKLYKELMGKVQIQINHTMLKC